LLAASSSGYGMTDVIRWVWTQEEFEVRALLQAGDHEKALLSAENSWMREDRARSSVYTTLTAALRVFDYEQVVLNDGPFFDLEQLVASQSDTLYICSPIQGQEEFRPLFTGVLRTVAQMVFEKNSRSLGGVIDASSTEPESASHTSPCRLLLMLDEAGVIAPLEDLESIATTAAGASIQVVSIFHDISQIEAIYGSYAARSIINNHSALVVLPGLRDIATLEYIEALLRGEQVANSLDGQWIGPRPIRGLRRGEALLVYENLRPVVLKIQSKFTDSRIAGKVVARSGS